MATLTITSKGQVTFRKEILDHLGLRQGDKIEISLMAGGCATLRPARPSGSIDDFLGLLAGKTAKVATLEEIDEAASAGWASTQ
jgi:AbrB family looped-hinge helix DNA binding protein